MEKTVSEAISYRRSVRLYKDQKIDDNKVLECIKNASIAPNSSNLQLWEFYQVTAQHKLTDLSAACFNQSAAKSAQQMVVFVSRKDLWKKRAHANMTHLNKGFEGIDLDERLLNRKKQVNAYYSKIIP